MATAEHKDKVIKEMNAARTPRDRMVAGLKAAVSNLKAEPDFSQLPGKWKAIVAEFESDIPDLVDEALKGGGKA
jgi:hypothetical protein